MSGNPDRLPEPTPQQIALGLEAIRRTLNGEKILLRRDGEGRLCVIPVAQDEIERA